MADFYLDSVTYNSFPNFENRLVIWVWNPDEIPPHVAISLNGIYFSLTVRGKEIKTTDQLVKSVKRKKSKLLFIEVENSLTVDHLNASFQSFEKAGISNSTCSTPIFKSFNAPVSVTKLSEFLEFLKSNGQIKAYFSVNLFQSFKEIPHYDLSVIQNKIKHLING